MKGKIVIYVGDSQTLPDGFAESARERFSAIGYRFVILSDLLRDLFPVVSHRRFPVLDCPDPESAEARIRAGAGLDGKTGFLYKKKRSRSFRFRETEPPSSLAEETDALIDLLRTGRRALFWKKLSDPDGEMSGYSGSSVFYDILEYDGYSDDLPSSEEPVPEERLDSQILFRVSPDPHTEEILSEIRRILQVYHLSVDDLEILLGYTVRLSRMKITRTGRILMTDFGNREIKMDHLTKMVFFFYLRHPEGVRFKEVNDYLEELLHIYMGITGRDDPEEIRKSVAGHVDPYGNGLKVSASRIKRAFREPFGDRTAKFYCLEGKKGEPYSVAIDRDYVIWEYPE